MAKTTQPREPRTHIMLVPGTIPFRLLCDLNPTKAGKQDFIADTQVPESATCPDCKARYEVLVDSLRKKLTRPRNPVLEPYYEWASSGDAGVSSRTIVATLTGADVLSGFGPSAPRDPSDFGRCHRLLKRFPELRERLNEVAVEHPRWSGLVAAWDELERLFEEESPTGECPKLWARMKEVADV